MQRVCSEDIKISSKDIAALPPDSTHFITPHITRNYVTQPSNSIEGDIAPHPTITDDTVSLCPIIAFNFTFTEDVSRQRMSSREQFVNYISAVFTSHTPCQWMVKRQYADATLVSKLLLNREPNNLASIPGVEKLLVILVGNFHTESFLELSRNWVDFALPKLEFLLLLSALWWTDD